MVTPQNLAGWRWAAVNEAGYTIGQYQHGAKVSDEDVELILELRAAGLSYRAIARKFDDGVRISKSTVEAICNGRRRAHTVMRHRLVPLPRNSPADPGEFD